MKRSRNGKSLALYYGTHPNGSSCFLKISNERQQAGIPSPVRVCAFWMLTLLLAKVRVFNFFYRIGNILKFYFAIFSCR